jgi:hypothetical protein
MKTTYYIEGLSDNCIHEYFDRLSDAKRALRKLFKPNHARIMCLKGPYKYEGYYFYEVTYDGKKFKRKWLL